MNERILDFAIKSGHIVGQLPLNANEKIQLAGLEKFAELIVKECIRVPYDMWDKAELNADVAVKIDHRIKEHFGVEE